MLMSPELMQALIELNNQIIQGKLATSIEVVAVLDTIINKEKNRYKFLQDAEDLAPSLRIDP